MKKKKEDLALKEEDFKVGDRLEGSRIVAKEIYKGKAYFIVEHKNDRVTVLQMSRKCKTYPCLVRNIPKEILVNLVETLD